MLTLAARMSRAQPSAIMEIAMKAKRLAAQGRDIISFSIGVPNFLPGPHVYEAAAAALQHDSGQYGSNRGADALLDAYLTSLERGGISGYGRNHVATGVGAKHILFNLLYAMLDEGDEVLIPTPYWTSYVDIVDILGAKKTFLPCSAEQDYKLRPEQIAAAVGPNTKALLFNNPSNPTGMVYTREEIAALAAELVKHDIYVLSDDIYNQMIYDGVGWHHLINAEPALRDRVILIDSISKTYGMPGWRVGFMAGPEHIAKACVTLNSNHITNLPEVICAGAVAALTGPQDVPQSKCVEFAGRRDQVLESFGRIEGMSCPRPQGAFYAFPDISFAYGRRYAGQVLQNDMDVCAAMLEAVGVACVPGSAFGEPKGMRISYTCKAAELPDGLARIEKFFAGLD
ncbi:MAG: pyridoxal phosphate-dependent aminotransferase [Xanthomonadales bacterium]|nr:pyridoxal phosphate-dependent aminotransferase [Xanthomonadales bacterium]